MILNVTSLAVMALTVNAAAEPPGTLSPTMTLYDVPSTLTFAERSLACALPLGVGVGVAAPGTGNGMNGSLLVNLSSTGTSLAGSAAASVAVSSEE